MKTKERLVEEICCCGKKYMRRNFPKNKRQTRVEVICHCDSCGKEWGTHNYGDEVNVKYECASCGLEIKGQCFELYKQNGNFCRSCCAEADRRAKDRNYNSSDIGISLNNLN